MANRVKRSRRDVRPLIPARAPSPQAQELLGHSGLGGFDGAGGDDGGGGGDGGC